MREIWRGIPGWPYYQVSSFGRVRSLTKQCGNRTVRGKIRALRRYPTGYLYVILYDGSHKKTAKVHRLVAEAFCEKSHGKNVVNHLDGNKSNNCANNLEWTTSSGNAVHALETGLFKPSAGEESAVSKLGELDVIAIREAIVSGDPVSRIANQYGVSVGAITTIKSGRNWPDAGGPDLVKAASSKSNRVINHPKTKLTENSVREIITLLSDQKPIGQIADIYGLKRGAVSQINRGVSWRHIRVPGLAPPYSGKFIRRS